MDWIQITNDPGFAAFAHACGVPRIMVDLEQHGKQERQGGLGTFISEHRPEDVAPVRAAVPRAHLIVRINPWHAQSEAEINHAARAGADTLMLPMFERADQIAAFSHACREAGVRAMALLETKAALGCLDAWAGLHDLDEIYVGLNDLHRQLSMRFMFEPLADGTVERVARVAREARKSFGFGGIARLDEGLLPGRVVLGEHLRLGSRSVILSRTFNRESAEDPQRDWRSVYRDQLARMGRCAAVLAARSVDEIESDRLLARDLIMTAARTLASR